MCELAFINSPNIVKHIAQITATLITVMKNVLAAVFVMYLSQDDEDDDEE